jgi:protein TonB
MPVPIIALAILVSGATPPIPPVFAPTHLPPTIVAALQRVVTQPKPRYPVQNVVSPDDYPAAAKGRGTVGMDLLTDKNGGVADCWITQSSGSWQLDAGTCNVVKRRARFTPALDRDGNPTLGKIAVQVDWENVFRRTRSVRAN